MAMNQPPLPTSPTNKSQLWDLIGQITVQVDQLMDQDGDTKKALSLLSDKLKRLTLLHGNCQDQERQMRTKQLGLMRERNLFLEKCRHIEQMGEQMDWQDRSTGTEQELLDEVHKILYSNGNNSGMEL